MKKQKGKLDKLQQRMFNEKHLKIQKALKNALKGLSRSELKQITKIKSNTTIRKHLKLFLQTGHVREKNRTLYWVTRYIERLGENLEAVCQELQPIINHMLEPENLWRWRMEGEFELSEEVFERGYVTAEELTKMIDQKEKVFGGLRRIFTSLAKVLMKADAGVITAAEDLSNVEVHFINEEPVWIVHPEPYSL